MDKHQILRECMDNMMLLTQLGLSIAVPPLLCLYAAGWLRDRLGLGAWILIPALVLGIASGLMGAWNLWKQAERRRNKRSGK